MKNCYKCGEIKPVDLFHKNRAQHDGLHGTCKDCERANRKMQRVLHPERFKAKSARHYQKHKKEIGVKKRKYRLQNPQKIFAHNELRKAFKRGEIKRPKNCGECEKDCKPDAHHEDYSKPLDVNWLCRSCHMRHHK